MDLELSRIEQAASVIDPVFLGSPQYEDRWLDEAVGRRVVVKVETLNPIRSFKGRGTDWFFHTANGVSEHGVVCASSGNFGQAVAYNARKRDIPVDVYTSTGVNPDKKARMEALGARVLPVGADGADAKAIGKQAAADTGRRFVEDGGDAAIAEGAGTIGVELLRTESFDTVVLPVGDGALVTGVARWVKEHRPDVRVVGVCAEGAPSMVLSWRAGEVVTTAAADTIADGTSISVPVPESVTRLTALVDDMVLVTDDDLRAMLPVVARTVGVLAEPSGVVGLTAIAKHDLPGERFATVITGANPRPEGY